MKYLLLLILSFSISWSAEKKDDSDVIMQLMASAKFSGGCGIIGQMMEFQRSTKMDGGDAFILRFLNTESARLGFSVEQYLRYCKDSNELYEQYWSAFEQMEKEEKRK